MANTRYLRDVVEGYVRGQLADEFGQPFTSQILVLSTGGTHEFDAVSEDGRLVASIKSASGLTRGGRVPSGKIKDSTAELYYLSLVEAPRRLLILTDPEFYEIFLRTMAGRILDGLEVRAMLLPKDIRAEVDKVVAEASREVSPSRADKAIAAEIELEMEEESTTEGVVHRNKGAE